ncbi:MAG: isoaspartyl peptidase/L-asparaginase [Chloroflexi bacterium]|nr:isoaspartyl peptidase/L-asparaginase [Chloroflexota bacterium]
MREKWHEWRKQFGFDPKQNLTDAVYSGADPKRSGGTTVYLAQDANGDIAAVTSTSGWAWKYPGRLGIRRWLEPGFTPITAMALRRVRGWARSLFDPAWRA